MLSIHVRNLALALDYIPSTPERKDHFLFQTLIFNP